MQGLGATGARVGRGGWLGRGEGVGEGDVAAGAEAADVGAVFVFDAEEGPDGAAADFGE